MGPRPGPCRAVFRCCLGLSLQDADTSGPRPHTLGAPGGIVRPKDLLLPAVVVERSRRAAEASPKLQSTCEGRRRTPRHGFSLARRFHDTTRVRTCWGGPLPKALWKWREPRTRQTRPPATPATAAQPAFGDAARGPLFSPTPVPGGETVQDLWPIMPPFLLCVRLLKSYEK